MAFVVEDGTGVPGANSYATDAEFLAYFTDRGRDLSTGFTVAQREAALVRGTDYLETNFTYVGVKESRDQGLSWPRIVDFPNRDDFEYDDIPEPLKRALYEYALEALYGSLYPNGQLGAPSVAPGTGGAILSAPLRRERKKIGQMEKEVEFNVRAGAFTGELRPIPAADNLLKKRGLVVQSRAVFRA